MGEMNSIIVIAKKNKRDYVSPEDVTKAIQNTGYTTDGIVRVRLELLEILGRQTGYGVEDASLCAYIAWRGDRST